jgi:dTDP-4-dehydrorhamnose reductase
MKPLRVVVTGRQGQVVQALSQRAEQAGTEVIAIGRPTIDLLKPQGVVAALEAARPDVIISAAAYTAVDLAETEPDVAWGTNVTGAGAVGQAAAALSVPVVHLSTDYVFDGKMDRPYREDDPTLPTGTYGISKLAGEHAIAAANSNHTILRTAWVYGPLGKNFVRTMLMLAGSRLEVSVVADQQGSPTSAQDIADGVLTVARNLIDNPDDAALRGIFHMTGGGETTWAGFAEAIFALSRQAGGPYARVHSISTSEYPTPAERPKNSCLNCSKIAQLHGVRLPAWRESLQRCIARLVPKEFSTTS